MCTGFEMALLGMSAVGTLQSISAARDAAERDAQIQERQAIIDQQRAEEDARRSRERFAKLKGEQRAKFAKGGVTFEGTPAAMLAATAEDEELEALSILHSGRSSAESRRISAASARAEGKAAATTALISGGTSLLTSGIKYQKTGNILGIQS